ncbi:unnamed protein product [Gongylonema pulchrum]|uniref:Nuclear transcription factor Y subunit n=1 Tax=Gongylonema pulchrum TaxID=637853 RepID=A0A183DHB7_9BILA|nr:unnamed protein product [Gongylonema pulchrum]
MNFEDLSLTSIPGNPGTPGADAAYCPCPPRTGTYQESGPPSSQYMPEQAAPIPQSYGSAHVPDESQYRRRGKLRQSRLAKVIKAARRRTAAARRSF